jgi:hypothetical protein
MLCGIPPFIPDPQNQISLSQFLGRQREPDVVIAGIAFADSRESAGPLGRLNHIVIIPLQIKGSPAGNMEGSTRQDTAFSNQVLIEKSIRPKTQLIFLP